MAKGGSGTLSHVAILIDYENLHWSMKNYYGCSLPLDDLTRGLRGVAAEHGTLCLAYAFADFDTEEFHGLPGQLLKRGIEPQYVLGKLTPDGHRKNAVDIEMSVAAVEMIFTRPDITTFVFATGDRDMLNATRRIHAYGRTVHAVASDRAMSADLKRFANRFTSLEELFHLRRPAARSGDAPAPETTLEDVVTRLEGLEQSRLPFVGLKYFIENHFADDKESAYRAVNQAIADGLIQTYQVPNPYGSFPVTACRINRDHPRLPTLLGQQANPAAWRPAARNLQIGVSFLNKPDEGTGGQ